MATGTSFKQQCPSCEAMVPIRDQGLIGKKIDCPKCKYRFIVEPPPEPEEEDDAPASKKKKGDSRVTDKPAAKAGSKAGPRKRGEDDAPGKPAKKKSGGGSGMLIIGGGLGLAAIVAIVVCAIALWPGDGGGGSASSSPPPGGGGTAPPPSGGEAAPETPAGTAGTPKPQPPSVLVNVSNLLPNDTEAVVAYPMPFTLGSALKAAAISETEGGFKPERFRQTMGFEVDDLHRVINALNSKDSWLFTIVQTKKPYNPDMLKAQLGLMPQPQVKGKSGKMHDVYLLQRDLDSLSTFLVKLNQPRESLLTHFYDPNTIIFGDAKPVKKFLEDDGKPEFVTKEGGSEAPAGGAAGGAGGSGGPMNPMGGGPPPAPGAMDTSGDGGRGGPPPRAMGSFPPGMAGGYPGTAVPAAPESTTPRSWMTIDHSLKLLLDRIEKLEDNRTTRRKEPASLVTVVGMFSSIHGPIMTEVNKQLSEQEMPSLQKFLAQQFISNELRKFKTVGVSLVSFDQREAKLVVAAEYRDRRDALAHHKQLQPLLPLALPAFKEALGLEVTLGAPPQNQGGFPGMGSPIPGFGGSRGAGGGSLGAVEGAPPPPATGGPPPQPGFVGREGEGGPLPGGGMPEVKSDGTLTIALEDRVLVGTLDLHLTTEAYEKLYFPTREVMHWVKGQADLAARGSRVHELARALKAYFDERGEFPPGALPRSLSAERVLPWRPDQRLSWVAALLPYLGEDFRDWKIDPDAAWNEGKNLFVATRIVPPLIYNKSSTNTGSVLVTYPGQPDVPVAATHFVGMAGLGLDAAEYRLGDQATANKVGIFGYDRVVKKADIKDGLDKTIALIMVPGEHKAPWLAGGGATVRGVPDDPETTKPIAPFVCLTHNGKKGTLAIMADGKVRFLPEDISPELFRALCTIAGGEKIGRLDAVCPVIEEPEQRQIHTTTLPGVGIPAPPATTPPASATNPPAPKPEAPKPGAEAPKPAAGAVGPGTGTVP